MRIKIPEALQQGRTRNQIENSSFYTFTWNYAHNQAPVDLLMIVAYPKGKEVTKNSSDLSIILLEGKVSMTTDVMHCTKSITTAIDLHILE